MEYMENSIWEAFYKELDPEKRRQLYEEACAAGEDDGANALRLELMETRYHDPKKPGKRVDRGVWSMVLMPAFVHGVFLRREATKQQIRDNLAIVGINEKNMADPVLQSAVYWEIRNIARRFYATCESPQYGRKLFGLKDATWEEKQLRCANDVWIMGVQVARTFEMEDEIRVFCDAVIDQFKDVSLQAGEIFAFVDEKLSSKKRYLPIIL